MIHMAPGTSLPNVDMSMIQQSDVLQSYWLLFQHMKEDFVHKEDLKLILSTNLLAGVANPPDFALKGQAVFPSVATDASARAKAAVYKALAETGGAVREGAVEGLETLTS